MKNLKTLVIILTATLFFTACEKEESPEVFDTISGVLSAGENVSADDLNGIEIYLGKFHDSVDFSSITFQTTAIDSVDATTINADGSFAFTSLTPGNYGIAMEAGYIFTIDTALVIHLDGDKQNSIKKSVEICLPDNALPAVLGEYMYLQKGDLSTLYQLEKIHTYDGEYNSPSFTDGSAKLNLNVLNSVVKFEIRINDQSENKVGESDSGWIPLNFGSSKVERHTYDADPVLITWIPYSISGMWPWRKKIDGHYLFTNK